MYFFKFIKAYVRLGLILLICSEQSARLVVDRVLFSDFISVFTFKFA